MVRQRPDRRVRRTRGRLKEALLELIDEVEGDYDAITIEDITERADVGRSTFYSHFTSKEDLLFSGFDHWLLSLTGMTPDGRVADETQGGAEDGSDGEDRFRFRFSLPLLRHIRSQRRFFQATIVRGSNAAIRHRITALLAAPVRVELERMSPSPARPAKRKGTRADAALLREGQAHAVVGALLGLVAWWLHDAPRLSAEAVDRLFHTVVRVSHRV
jgi:AcrR family transcriptional regulator